MGVNNGRGPVARSRYRQMRLTATQETSGRFSYAIYAKGLNQEWHEHQCLLRGSLEHTPLPLLSTEDVVAILIDLLREQLLPGID